jgi:hypothetical protein
MESQKIRAIHLAKGATYHRLEPSTGLGDLGEDGTTAICLDSLDLEAGGRWNLGGGK